MTGDGGFAGGGPTAAVDGGGVPDEMEESSNMPITVSWTPPALL